MSVERFISAKELADSMSQFGLDPITYKRALKLIEAMIEHGMPAMYGRLVRPSDAYAFLAANPRWKPYTQKKNV